MTQPSKESLQLAAQAWGEPEAAHVEMNERIAIGFARILDRLKSSYEARLKEQEDRPSIRVLIHGEKVEAVGPLHISQTIQLDESVEPAQYEQYIGCGTFAAEPEARLPASVIHQTTALRDMRKNAGVTLGDLAEYLKVSVTELSALEIGDLKRQRVERQAALQRQDATFTPPTELPDGSGVMVGSWPLPPNHWIYGIGSGMPNPPKHFDRAAVVLAARFAIRDATRHGTLQDFDPDCIVQRLVSALFGWHHETIEKNDVGDVASVLATPNDAPPSESSGLIRSKSEMRLDKYKVVKDS